MDDLILSSRLDSLEQNLTQIVGNSEWLRDCVLKRYAPQQTGSSSDWPPQVWDELDSTVGSRSRQLKSKLQQIRTLLANAANKNSAEAAADFEKAWQAYKQVYEESQEVFCECLEYIGGLALRDRGFDQRICDIADQLIVSSAKDWNNLKWQSLTILAAQERLGQTIARIIRLRFPEWTIWTLPFTAREFAHVAFHANENSGVLTFVNEKRDELVEKEPRLVEARKLQPGVESLDLLKRAQRYARNHIHELIADAFATYTMGPAYACAAILLRLNPIGPSSEGLDHPTDAKRAEMVLETLKQMNEQATGQPPYDDIIRRLDAEWNAARARARIAPTQPKAGATPRLEDLIDVPNLVKETLAVFLDQVREQARFPYEDSENGWLKAQDWHRTLMNNFNNGLAQLNGVQITKTSRLRDALNAAWLCRIYAKPGGRVDINTISALAQKLCEAIITVVETKSDPDTRPAVGAGSLGGLPPAQSSFK